MNNEEFKKLLLEQTIYEDLKDNLKITTMAQIRFYLDERGIVDKVDGRRLYVKLTNYRIKKYGTSIFMITDTHEQHKYILNDYRRKK